MKTLKPIVDKLRYYQIIEDEIKSFLYLTLYKPVLDMATAPLEKSFENASAFLINAIRDNKIAYVEGFFVGEFNSKIGLEIRRLGGIFNHTRKAYTIERYKLPLDIQTAINEGDRLLKQRVKNIYGYLEDLQKNPPLKSINLEPHFEGIFIDLDKQFSTTISKDLSVPIDKTPYMEDALRKNYLENLDLGITELYSKSVQRLRAKVYKNVEEGFRATKLVPIIQGEKNISYRHALFIAKQETSLLVSKYREARYTHAGLKRYKWLTSEDARVRPNAEARKTGHTSNNHRSLNLRIFSWDDPPVVDSATNRKCNPGEDFGCRCLALPIIE